MPELPGSRVMMVGPGASAGTLPVGGELERVAATESQAPDPAWVASIAELVRDRVVVAVKHLIPGLVPPI